MKHVRAYAAWFYLFLLLAIAACGGSEGVVSSNSTKNESAGAENQGVPDNNSDDMLHSETPADTNPGGGSGGGN